MNNAHEAGELWRSCGGARQPADTGRQEANASGRKQEAGTSRCRPGDFSRVRAKRPSDLGAVVDGPVIGIELLLLLVLDLLSMVGELARIVMGGILVMRLVAGTAEG